MSGRATEAMLHRLWHALLNHLLHTMENPPEGGIKASFLAVVVRFLADNGCVTPDDGERAGASRNALQEKLKRLQADAENAN